VVASLCDDGRTRLWRSDSSALLAELPIGSSPFAMLRFDRSGRRLAVAANARVALWDVADPRAPAGSATSCATTDAVRCWSSARERQPLLATAADDGVARLWTQHRARYGRKSSTRGRRGVPCSIREAFGSRPCPRMAWHSSVTRKRPSGVKLPASTKWVWPAAEARQPPPGEVPELCQAILDMVASRMPRGFEQGTPRRPLVLDLRP